MNWQSRRISAEKAAAKIRSGQRVFLTGNCSTPQRFMEALCERYEELQSVEIVQLLDLGAGNYVTPEIYEHIRINSLFISGKIRNAINNGMADFTPVFLSEIPSLFRWGRLVLDVAVIHVSPPDEHGYCSYGVEVGVSKSAAESAGMVIAEVNPNMPRTLGDSFIHVNQIDYFIEVDYTLPELTPEPASPVQAEIAHYIAELVPDAATMQMGIGGMPDAVLRRLTHHKNLGVHTELFSDGVMEMIEAGVITCAAKSLHAGKVVAGFVLGTQKLYHFINDNPVFEMHPTEYVNDPFIIAQNERMVSINSALEMDLTGQVCADSIGHNSIPAWGDRWISCEGHHAAKAACRSLPYPVPQKMVRLAELRPLKPGSGVTTSRNDVRYVATEYGVADLFGRSIAERAHALINIAHPKFRDELTAYAREQHYLSHVYSLGG